LREESIMSRVLSLSLAAVALALFVGRPAPAQQAQQRPNPAPAAQANADNTHEGKFVMAEGNSKFVMADKTGNRHEHMLAQNARVMCDGKECKLSDLKEGIMIRVTTERNDQKVATRLEARTKGDFDNSNRNEDLNRK
jgi:hypothetical protein